MRHCGLMACKESPAVEEFPQPRAWRVRCGERRTPWCHSRECAEDAWERQIYDLGFDWDRWVVSPREGG